MFLSPLHCNSRAPTWSKVAQYMTTTTVCKMMSTETPNQLQLEPEPQSKRKTRRRTRNQALDRGLRTTSLRTDNSSPVQGVQNVVQQLGTVSLAKPPISGSTPEFALRLKAFEQSMIQTSKQVAVQANIQPSKKAASPRRVDRDGKIDPSPASGGIPNPTVEYLRTCTSGLSSLRQPQHLLVVIDLNGTLLFRPSKKRPTNFNMRPHAQTFLKYCVDTFTVVIWSSARAENVNAMCNTILTPDIRSRVAAIWGRDKFGLSRADFDLRVQCYKRLSKVWKDPNIAGTHPAYHEGFRWDQTNTVLIDDSREKARSEPHNLIEVPEWFGDTNEKDRILPQVHDYLNHLSMSSNVSACLHSRPWKPTVF